MLASSTQGKGDVRPEGRGIHEAGKKGGDEAAPLRGRFRKGAMHGNRPRIHCQASGGLLAPFSGSESGNCVLLHDEVGSNSRLGSQVACGAGSKDTCLHRP